MAARKIIRLGVEEFVRDEHTFDGGHITPTPEEIEKEKQLVADIVAYKTSIWLVIMGTLVWAYGGIFLRFFCSLF